MEKKIIVDNQRGATKSNPRPDAGATKGHSKPSTVGTLGGPPPAPKPKK